MDDPAVPPDSPALRAPEVSSLIAGAPRELLEALLASVADAVYLVDAEGRVRFVNPAGLEVLGYDDASELLGRVSHPTIHYKRPDGSHFPAEECPMLRPRLTGETVRVDEDWFVRRDGTMVPVAYSSAPFPSRRAAGRSSRSERSVTASPPRRCAGERRSTACACRRSRRRAHGSSPPPTPSAGASGATCMTVPSNAWSTCS